MNLRRYLTIMSLGTILCWIAWTSVIYSFDPFASGIIGISFFYTSLFLALLGTVSVVGFFIRWLLIKQDDIVFRHVRRTFRQAIIAASLTILTLLLLHAGLLRWWNSLLLILLGFLLEAVFFTNRKYRNVDYTPTSY